MSTQGWCDRFLSGREAVTGQLDDEFQVLWKTKQGWPGQGHTSSPGHNASEKAASESPGCKQTERPGTYQSSTVFCAAVIRRRCPFARRPSLKCLVSTIFISELPSLIPFWRFLPCDKDFFAVNKHANVTWKVLIIILAYWCKRGSWPLPGLCKIQNFRI